MKKPSTHIRISGQVATPPHQFKGFRISNTSNHASFGTYLSHPETRKAQMEEMIRPRIPTRYNDAQRFISDVSESYLKEDSDKEKILPMLSSQTPKLNLQQQRSPFKVVVEDVDQTNKRQIPRFGRRKPPQDEDYNLNRVQTNIVEGNSIYNQSSKDYPKLSVENTYSEAVEKRQKERGNYIFKRDLQCNSPSTSEERERAAPGQFQKESFTTSSDATESSEEPFKVISYCEEDLKEYPATRSKIEKQSEMIASKGMERTFDENQNTQRIKKEQVNVEKKWMQPSWYDVRL